MARDTVKLRELIFSILNNDDTLQGLLGGAGKVRHGNPLQLSEYPCVVYTILIEVDEAYNPDIPTNITQTTVNIQAFSTSTSSKEVDKIDDRIYALLHGQKLSNTDFVVYTSYRRDRTPLYEAEVQVWRIDSAYDLVNVLK